MEKNFSKEIKLIDECTKLKDKMLILVSYEELYRFGLESMKVAYSEEFDNYMKNSLEIVIDRINKAEDIETLSGERFMKLYREVLQIDEKKFQALSSDIDDSIELLRIFPEDEELKYKATIYTLEEQFNIYYTAAKYIDEMRISISKLFNESCALHLNILLNGQVLLKHAAHTRAALYLKLDEKRVVETLEPALKERAYECLIKEYENGCFQVENIMDPSLKRSIQDLSEVEQKVWLVCMIHSITGYTLEQKGNEKIKR